MFGARPDADEVLPGLLMGSAPGRAGSAKLARRKHISRVLDLRELHEGPPARWPAHVEVRSYPIPDRACPDPAALTEVAGWLRRQLGADHRVLVHCLAGQGRAPTIVLALLVSMGYSLSDAHRLLRERRPQVAPTDAQLEGLRLYERSLGGSGSSPADR